MNERPDAAHGKHTGTMCIVHLQIERRTLAMRGTIRCELKEPAQRGFQTSSALASGIIRDVNQELCCCLLYRTGKGVLIHGILLAERMSRALYAIHRLYESSLDSMIVGQDGSR